MNSDTAFEVNHLQSEFYNLDDDQIVLDDDTQTAGVLDMHCGYNVLYK